MEKKKKEKFSTFDRVFWVLLLFSLILMVLICFLPKLLTKPGEIDFTRTGQIGDTIGGIMSPFVAMIATLLTFLAFWVQYKANKQQREDIAKERFERHVFGMLDAQEKITSELVLEIKLNGTGTNKGVHYNRLFSQKSEIDDQMAIDVKVWTSDFIKSPCKDNKDNVLGDNLIKQTGRDVFQLIYEDAPLEYESKTAPLKELLKKYNGMRTLMANEKHIWFLDHYFRHLYRIYKYIDEYDEEVITPEMKKEYAGIVRSHLSPYELVMIFYNSFTKPKFEELIVKYNVLKNIRMELLATDEDREKVKEMNKKEKEHATT